MNPFHRWSLQSPYRALMNIILPKILGLSSFYPCNLYPFLCHVFPVKNSWSSQASWASETDVHRPLASFLVCLIIALPGVGSAQPFNGWIHNFPSIIHPYRVFPTSSASFQSLSMNQIPAETMWQAFVTSHMAMLFIEHIKNYTCCFSGLETARHSTSYQSFYTNMPDRLVLACYAKSHFCLNFPRVPTFRRVHTHLEKLWT